jgi:hypothetical protein
MEHIPSDGYIPYFFLIEARFLIWNGFWQHYGVRIRVLLSTGKVREFCPINNVIEKKLVSAPMII